MLLIDKRLYNADPRFSMDLTQWRIKGMAGMAHVIPMTHRYHFDGGVKITWQKMKFVSCSFFNLYVAPHTTIDCTAASTQHTYLSNAIIWACCASVTKHWDKTDNTTIRHCDWTRTLACRNYKTLCFSHYRKGSAAQSVRAVRFRQEPRG